MEHNTLSSLLTALEFGSKLHICVVFLDRYGNRKTKLPFSQRIHQCPVCDSVKAADGLDACFHCRNTVLKWAIRHRRSFGGLCVKGVFEYCRPVIRDENVAAVIFIGNILTNDIRQKQRLKEHVAPTLLKTMQTDFTRADCARTADLVESYIHYLLDRYGEFPPISTSALIDNVKSYIAENLIYDFSMKDLADMFNYNEKYLGRLFKEKTGQSVREYCNAAKLERAKALLKYSKLNVADIAGQSGFNNVTYFNRIFKKSTDLSPQEYRNQEK